MRRVVAAVLILGVLLISIPLPAGADSEDGVITRYDLTATAAKDGTTQVAIDFTIDFGTSPKHGPYVTLPVRQEIPNDPDHYRAFDIDQIAVSSSTGAPTEVDTDTEYGAMAIKVGDPRREVTGPQKYRLTYTTTGLVNPNVSGSDEIFWNAIGDQWTIPRQNITVTLIGPADVTRSTCYAGEPSARTTCGSDTPDGRQVSFTQPQLSEGEGMTVVAAWPAGTFVGAEPRLIARYSPGNTFTANPGTLGAGVIVAVLGSVLLVLRSRRRGRDEQYAGITPGSTPSGSEAGSASAAVEAVGGGLGGGETAVAFTPPPGVPPGVLGTLIDTRAQSRDVTASIVDLAVRGHLRIEEVPKESKRAKPDWRLVRLESSDRLAPWESDLIDGIFGQEKSAGILDRMSDAVFGSEPENEITLSDLRGTFSETLRKTEKSLNAEVTGRGWFRTDPNIVRRRSLVLAAVLFFGGLLATFLLAVTLGWGFIGLAVIVVGIVGFVAARTTPGRSAAGTAVQVQGRGFEQYLKTAEADQLRFEEGVDIFSRYLPYAIVFEVTERWTKIFTQLAADGRYPMEPGWYVGNQAVGMGVGLNAFSSGGFADSLTAFSSAATSAMTAGSSGSGGGSGFGGGVGGGVGGGGGGSW